MKFVKYILICLSTVVLFYISWPPNSTPGFIFFAFCPILFLVFNFNPSHTRFKNLYLFGLLLSTFFCLNFALTYWVIYAHWLGGIFASVFNAFLMTAVFLVVHKIKAKLGKKQALISFPILWLAFEYLHLNWEMSWPWMSLGHVFSDYPNWIQWYEYTGVLGGSAWVLGINTIVYISFENFIEKKRSYSPILFCFLGLTIPLICSNRLTKQSTIGTNEKVNIVLVQPNFEPHKQKFTIPQAKQIQKVATMLEAIWDKNPDLIILPETFITDWIWESRIETSAVILKMKSWLKNHPNTQIVTGASTGKILQKKDAIKSTARTSTNGTVYEVFNTALLITDKQETQIFHKSKLVPGAEMTPFSYILKPFFNKFPMKIGGSIGNFGTNDSLQNFASFKGTFTPTICYESIYGEYVSSFHSLGSNWICIITNDGWWGNTFGHQQHQSYARLRAIENRKYVIRSANTGISSVINPMGKVEQLLPYGKEGIIESEITKHNRVTFYAKHGDYIGRLASFLGIIYLLQLILVILKNNVTHLKNE